MSTAAAWRAVLGVVAVAVNVVFLFRAYSAYSEYQLQFLERVTSIETQKASGVSPVVMLCYPNLKRTKKFLQKYLHSESCNLAPGDWTNSMRARHFQVPELIMKRLP
jgi:hypothetical protein